jgi:hypothetical protein
VQNVRGIIDYSKNDRAGYILCDRFEGLVVIGRIGGFYRPG